MPLPKKQINRKNVINPYKALLNPNFPLAVVDFRKNGFKINDM